MRNFSGTFNYTSYYGEISLNSPKDLQTFILNADKSEIKLKAIPIKKLDVILSTSFGQINIPAEMGTVKTVKNNSQVSYNSSENSSIKITNKSGNITLEKL